MKKILVPTDFSSNADEALDFAVQIAKQAKAEIFLIHACNLVDTTFKDHLTIKKEHNKALLDTANEKLALLKNSIEDIEHIAITTKIYNGSITDSILEAAEENDTDFIVIGTRGQTELKEKIFGSTTSGILGKTKVPLLVVSPLSKWDNSETTLAATIPDKSGKFTPDAATIHVAVFVDTDVAEAYDYVYNIGELGHYIKFLEKTYPEVTFKGELLEGENFESTIENYSDKNSIDLIAMITYPKTFWDKLLNKSVTKDMAFHSKVPVLAVKAK